MRFQAVRSPLSVSRALAFAAVLILLAPRVHATSVEGIFAAARNYTAYIETRIETPFIEDDPGSYLGAGFIVDRDRGWVITNAHVVGHSPAELTVTFADGTKTRATPVYIDSFLDLALIAVRSDLTRARAQASLDCTEPAQVGVPVGAYGHPNGYKFSGTRGIVSGFSNKAGAASLQTDAPINAGNSGGPLIRLDTGRVIGINTQSLTGDDVQNMNFAVEARYACRVLTLLQHGADPRPAALDLLFFTEDDEPTLVIAETGARASGAGLRAGDRILGVAHGRLSPATKSELVHRLRGESGEVSLEVQHANGTTEQVPYAIVPYDDVLARRGIFVAGALLAPTTFEDAALLTSRPSLMVHFVAPGSAAEAAGLACFDQLVAVNGQAVADVDEVADLTRSSQQETMELSVLRIVRAHERFVRHVRVLLPKDDEAHWVAMRQPAIVRPKEPTVSGRETIAAIPDYNPNR